MQLRHCFPAHKAGKHDHKGVCRLPMKDWRFLGVMKRFGLRGLKDKATEAALYVAQFWSDAAYVAKPQLASPARDA